MNIKNNQNIYYIDFPERYNDPRDFHEAVLQTIQESQKIKLPKLAKTNPQLAIGYLSLSGDILDTWFIILYLSLLVNNGYENLCVMVCDYKSSQEYSMLEEASLQSVFASTPSKFIPIADINKVTYDSFSNLDAIICAAQIINPLQGFYIMKISINRLVQDIKKQTNQKNQLADFLKKNNSTILVVGNEIEDEEAEFGGDIVFDWICKGLKRSIKKVPFKSMIGDLYLYVA